MKLIELPNGSFVDPNTVQSITPLPTHQCKLSRLYVRARVIISHGEHMSICYANDDEHAYTMARELAAQVNQTSSQQ